MNLLLIILVLLIQLWITMRFIKGGNAAIVNVFCMCYYAFQIILALFILFLLPDFPLYNKLLLRETILQFGCCSIVALLAICIAQKVVRRGSFSFKRLIDNVNVIKTKYDIDKVALYFSIFYASYLLIPFAGSYLILTLAYCMSFVPFVLGLFFIELRKSRKILWILTLFVSFASNLVQGSRGLAVMPILVFIVGYVLSIVDKSYFKKHIIIIIVCGLLFLPIFSAIGEFRKIAGRGIEVNAENINAMIDFVESSASDDTEESQEIMISGSFGRILTHANFAVPAMTPEKVPYRGLDYLEQEVIRCFSIAGEKGEKEMMMNRADEKFGSGFMTEYDFLVNSATSVPFPVLADGYSRFSYLGIFLYSFIIAFLGALSERFLRNKSLLGLCCYAFVLSYMYTAIETYFWGIVKLYVFRLPFTMVIVYFIGKQCRIRRKILNNSL